MRTLSATLLAGLLLSAASLAAPIQITGKILNPPKDVQVELRPWAVEYGEALRRLKGEAVPPIASAKPRLDGSFELKVPDSGFYSVVARAPGRLALERQVPFVVEETETPPVELPSVSPLEVKAVGPDGQPLAGVTIQALPVKSEGDWRAADRSAVTDAEGKAVFHRAEGEALILVVTTPGRYATSTTGARGASETVRFPAQRSRTVEIRGPNNKPAAGALVRLARRGWPYGLTGEDGRIALPVPLKDEIGLFAEDSRGLRIEIVMTVEAGEGTDVPAVALRSPTLSTGRVLEISSREPIPGALVWSGGTAWTRAGASGTFELRAPSGERGRIEGTAAGHTRALHRWQREQNTPITLLLGPAADISGQVVDEAGKPLAEAQVSTFANPEDYRTARDERKTRSGPDGRFVLRQLPAGRPHTIAATFEGLAPAIQIADSKTPVRLVLRRGATAAGRVVDDQGQPVADAELTLFPSEVPAGIPGPVPEFRATSAAEGRFQFQRVSPGRFDLRVSRRGFAPAVVRGVTLTEGEPRDLGDVALRPGGFVEGIVVDEGGKPVAQAGVALTPGGAEPMTLDDAIFFHRPPVETGPDGRFRLEDLPRGRRVGLEVMHQELVSTEVPGVEVPTAEPLRIQLKRPRTVEGRVTDRMGEPVAGARVFAVEGPSGSMEAAGIPRQMRGGRFATTDPEGRFTVSGLAPGTVDLQVNASGYRSRTSPGIRVPEEGQAAPIEITLEPGTFLEGLVMDARGVPVRDASVHVLQGGDPSQFRTWPTTTDEEGHYELGDLEPGSYQVTVSPMRGGAAARATVEIRPGRNRLDLKIPEGSEVSGRAVDADGAPLAGVTVSLLRQPSEDGGLQPMAERYQAVSTADGSFAIPDVTDGDYRLTGERPGLAAASLPGGLRVAGGPVAGLELRLGPAAAIRGRLIGIPPEQAARVMVAAHSEETGVYLQGVRDPSGGYRIEDVGPGTWTVTAFVAPQPPVQAEVQVSPGQEEVVQDLEFTPGFTLTGRVLLDQIPLARAQVMVSNGDPLNPVGAQTTAGHDGGFRLERLPAGTYRLLVLLPSGMTHMQAVDVAGDRDLTVEIATGTVEGRLLTAEGLPVAGAAISLRSEDPEVAADFGGPAARSDEQGAFEFPRIASGSYRMTIEAQGFAPAESQIVLTPGGIVRVDLALRPETR